MQYHTRHSSRQQRLACLGKVQGQSWADTMRSGVGLPARDFPGPVQPDWRNLKCILFFLKIVYDFYYEKTILQGLQTFTKTLFFSLGIGVGFGHKDRGMNPAPMSRPSPSSRVVTPFAHDMHMLHTISTSSSLSNKTLLDVSTGSVGFESCSVHRFFFCRD